MNNPPTISGAIHLYLLALLLTLSLAQPAHAQPPADSCNGSENTGAVMIPFSQSLMGPTDLIDTTNCGTMGESNGDDTVTCFTPQQDCTVDLTCAGTGSNTIGIASGACSDTPMSCSSPPGGASAGSVVITGFAATGGTQYCVYCQVTGNSSNMTTTIALNASSPQGCGLLPVDLLSFSVGSSEEEDEPPAESPD